MKAFARWKLRAHAFPVLVDGWVVRGFDALLAVWWKGAQARRFWLSRLFACALGVSLGAGATELVLRLPFLKLPHQLGETLFGCYDPTDTYQSIYFDEPRLRIATYKPNYSTTCYWSGYRWHHQGDRWGFRNPETWEQVDVVLLGDSFTYGHGLEQDETIAHHLRGELGVRVANLGITAGCPVDYAALLGNFGLPLSPKVAMLLLFANDVDDIAAKRTREELRAYVEHGTARELDVYDRDVLLAGAPDPKAWTLARLERWTLSYRTFRYYEPRISGWFERVSDRLVSSAWAAAPGSSLDERAADSPEAVHADWLDPVVRAYLRKLFGAMADSARAAGTELVVVSMASRADFWRVEYDKRTPQLWRDLAQAEGLAFLDLAPVLTGPDGSDTRDSRLPGDGHFSASGSRLVAAALARFLRERDLLRRD